MKKKLLCLMICLLCVTLTSCKSQDYENAQALLDAGEFDQAEQAFSDLGDYKDSAEKIKEAKYLKACSILDSGDIEQASSMFRDLIGYKDSTDKYAQTFDKMMINSHDLTLLENCEDFGISKEIAWTTNPKTNEELENNFIYSMLIGNYSLTMAFNNEEDALRAKEFYADQMFLDKMHNLYCDLCGFFAFSGCRYETLETILEVKDGLYVISMNYGIDLDNMHKEYVEGYNAAKAFDKKLHDEGKLKDDMDELEVAKVLYSALKNYAEVNENEYSGEEDISSNEFYHNNDTIYGFFVKKCCTCEGRASGFQMIMHIEGKKCAGVYVEVGGGHIINAFPHKDTLYVVDSGNQIPIMTLSDANNSAGYEYMKNDYVYKEYYTDLAKEMFGLS